MAASLSFALVGLAQTRGHGAHGKKAKPDADAGAVSSDATPAATSPTTAPAAGPAGANGTSANGTNGASATGMPGTPTTGSNAPGSAPGAASGTASGTTARPSTTANWPEVYNGGAKPSPLTPTPDEHLVPASAAAGVPPDYDRMIADIALLRARVAAVSDALFRSRLALSVQLDSDKQRLDKMIVALDDGPVWEAPAGFRADDPTPIYDHAVAPGRHAISVRIERKDSRDASFSTEQTSRFIVDVPKDQRLEVGVRLQEDSSMGGSFSDSHKGDYDLRVRVKAAAKPVGQ